MYRRLMGGVIPAASAPQSRFSYRRNIYFLLTFLGFLYKSVDFWMHLFSEDLPVTICRYCIEYGRKNYVSYIQYNKNWFKTHIALNNLFTHCKMYAHVHKCTKSFINQISSTVIFGESHWVFPLKRNTLLKAYLTLNVQYIQYVRIVSCNISACSGIYLQYSICGGWMLCYRVTCTRARSSTQNSLLAYFFYVSGLWWGLSEYGF